MPTIDATVVAAILPDSNNFTKYFFAVGVILSSVYSFTFFIASLVSGDLALSLALPNNPLTPSTALPPKSLAVSLYQLFF